MKQTDHAMPPGEFDQREVDQFNDITDERTREFTAVYQQMVGESSDNAVVEEDPTRRPLSEEDLKQEDHDIMPDYDIGDRLGRGGCAIVYEGWRKTDRFHVAIKQLAIPATIDEEEEHIARRRFYREAKLITSLQEKHIVQCVDYGVMNDGQPCMVLEYIKGKELGDYLQDPVHCKSEEETYLSIEKAVSITIQVLEGLSVSHSKTIIHRDIKPGNIMILDDSPEDNPIVKVLDFGIATVIDSVDNSSTLMTQQGNIRGTPSYMAPELFTGAARASVESDLYAVGLVLLECLTNKIAFEGASFMQVAYMQVNEQPDIPSYIPECLANIIRRACAKKREDRYHSADDMIRDLRDNLNAAVKAYPKCRALYMNQRAPSAVSLFWQAHKKHVLLGLGVVVSVVVLTFVLLVVMVMAVGDDIEEEENKEAQAALEAANAEKEKLSAEAQAAKEAQQRAMFTMTMDTVHEKIRSSWNGALIILDATAERELRTMNVPPSAQDEKTKSVKNTDSGKSETPHKKSGGSKKSGTSSGKKKDVPKQEAVPVEEPKKPKRDTMQLPTGFL